MLCPECSHLRRKKNNKCLSVKINAESGLWNCFNCGWHGGVFAGQERRNYVATRGKGDKSGDFGTARRRQRYNVFPGSWRGRKKQYFSNTRMVGSARAWPEKSFVAGGGFRLSFWNLSRVMEGGSDTVFITEGECDACALVEAGIPATQVLSVPNGAKVKPADDPKESRGYSYVLEALEAGLSKIKRFVWCGDSDDAGHTLREDMVKLLGAARFWFVNWPEGVKDANGMLLSDGAEAVRELVLDGALPWPVAGLYRLSGLPEPAPLVVWGSGFPRVGKEGQISSRTLSVVTRAPWAGKRTALWNQIWFNVVVRHGVVFCGASFETRPKPHIRRQLRTLISGKLEYDMDDFPEKASADRWIDDRYLFLVHPRTARCC